jgi:glutathionylspermidine synthase
MTESEKSARRMDDYIQHSDLNAGGNNYTRTLHIPKIYDKQTIRTFSEIVDRTYGIFEKVIQHYLDCSEYRKLFPFPKEMEELILLPAGYPVSVPVCRIDIFYNETTGEFKFCEFNTDGTSAMNENKVLDDILYMNNAWSHFEKEVPAKRFELVDSWVEAFLETYHLSVGAKEKPYVAIVDFLDKAYLKEFYVFERHFRNHGIEAEVCDIRHMTYKDGGLYTPTGHRVDAVYRRAVTSDVIHYYEEVQDFIQAVKDEKVCLIGAFKTQIVHHKAICQVLVHPMTKALLTPEENTFIQEHLPKTLELDRMSEGEMAQLLEDKDGWIIKPVDSYAAKGVYAGVDYSHKEWRRISEGCLGQNYIAQEYCHPYQTENINFDKKPHEFELYSNLTGLYTYNGRFQGVYSRMSDGGIISTQYNEKTVATRYLDEEAE